MDGFGLSVGLLPATALTGCGDDDDDDASDVERGERRVLRRPRRLRQLPSATWLRSIRRPPPRTTTSPPPTRSARHATTWSTGAADLSQAEWENLATQVDTLRDQLQDAPDDQAVQSILDEAKPQAVAVQASVAAVNTAVCTTGSRRRAAAPEACRRGVSPVPLRPSSTTRRSRAR